MRIRKSFCDDSRRLAKGARWGPRGSLKLCFARTLVEVQATVSSYQGVCLLRRCVGGRSHPTSPPPVNASDWSEHDRCSSINQTRIPISSSSPAAPKHVKENIHKSSAAAAYHSACDPTSCSVPPWIGQPALGSAYVAYSGSGILIEGLSASHRTSVLLAKGNTVNVASNCSRIPPNNLRNFLQCHPSVIL